MSQKNKTLAYSSPTIISSGVWMTIPVQLSVSLCTLIRFRGRDLLKCGHSECKNTVEIEIALQSEGHH